MRNGDHGKRDWHVAMEFLARGVVLWIGELVARCARVLKLSTTLPLK